MTQGKLDFSPPHVRSDTPRSALPRGKKGNVYERLLATDEQFPVSYLSLQKDARRYGTNGGRRLREFREDAHKYGVTLRERWIKPPIDERYLVFWVEKI